MEKRPPDENQPFWELLILADDFTGALDTAVQLTGYGKRICVLGTEDDISRLGGASGDVLVVNTNTRHEHEKRAFETVQRLTQWAVQKGVRYLYKKTDSALRGNVGAELDGMLKGSGSCQVFFVPAFPKLERTTKDGVQYWKGVPIHETAFGRDPFEPVKTSKISDILSAQGLASVETIRRGADPAGSRSSCLVFDAETEKDLQDITERIKEKVTGNGLAGCAGFAAWLPELLGWKKAEAYVPHGIHRMFVVSGSVHPVAVNQLKYAERTGFPVTYLDLKQTECVHEKLRLIESICGCFMQNGRMCLTVPAPDSGIDDPATHEIVSSSLAEITRCVMEKSQQSILMIIGGDTLASVLKTLGNHYVFPLCELYPGTVLSHADTDLGQLMIVTKSGGFGDEDVIVRTFELLCDEK